mgnify:CR=1 FL=1
MYKRQDITVSWENLYAINRKIIDPIAHRYFFVWEPVELTVYECPYEGEVSVSLPLHPDKPEEGHRTLTIAYRDGGARFLISGQDATNMEPGRLVRLMGLFNIEVLEVGGRSVKARFHSEELKVAREEKASLIHWLPIQGNVVVEVLRPDGTVEGFGEPDLAKEGVGSLVQLVRYGFGRVDEVGDGFVRICYAHK